MHPPYSLDLAPSNFHLFRSLSNFLRGKNLVSLNHKNALGLFFDTKPTEFYSSGIYKLGIRWKKVIDKDGQYIYKRLNALCCKYVL